MTEPIYDDCVSPYIDDDMGSSVSKDEYSKVLKAYQSYLDEIKSDQRDAAAAYDEEFKYY